MPKKYTLTEKHRGQLEGWKNKWVANAMSTKAMDDGERNMCLQAVKDMYRSANLEPPPDHRIIFVPSPFVLRFASGFASAIWYFRKTGEKTRAATDAATDAATRAATRAATNAATHAATYDATYVATYVATDDATHDATYDATYAATHDATDAATYAATYVAKKENNRWFNLDISLMVILANKMGVGKFGLECSIKCYHRMYQGGNQWSGLSAFLTFFRYIAKLPLDYSKFDAFEYLSEHSGPRIMHEKFCMISDRPEVLLVDDQNRPHCDNGPFCKWRDGTALYSIHGVRVPEWVVENPESITIEKILSEENAEVRRIMQERYGFRKFFLDMKVAGKCKEIDKKLDISGFPVTLYAYDDKGIKQHFVHVYNGTVEPDGTRHEFTINCKNINDDAFESVMGTYPDIMKLIEKHPRRMEMLRSAIRT